MLGELVAQLDGGELAVVVSADHGEELFDHALFGHGLTLFEETVRVPLVMSLPEAHEPRVAREVVSSIDVMPTLVEIAGGEPLEGVAGRSLVSRLHGEPLPPRPAVLETGFEGEVRAIVDGDTKYAESAGPVHVEGLYELSVNPEERRDLAADQPERAAALRARLHHIVDEAAARRPATTIVPVSLSHDDLERLHALGYAR